MPRLSIIGSSMARAAVRMARRRSASPATRGYSPASLTMRRARSLSVCKRTPATPFGRRDSSAEAIAEAMPLEATTTSSRAPEARRSATSAAMSRALARRRRGGIVGVGSIVRRAVRHEADSG